MVFISLVIALKMALLFHRRYILKVRRPAFFLASRLFNFDPISLTILLNRTIFESVLYLSEHRPLLLSRAVLWYLQVVLTIFIVLLLCSLLCALLFLPRAAPPLPIPALPSMIQSAIAIFPELLTRTFSQSPTFAILYAYCWRMLFLSILNDDGTQCLLGLLECLVGG